MTQQSNKGGEVKNISVSTKAGNTYALIVGVSKYQYPETYKTLNYADKDGRTFYNFLTSDAGGNISKDNIDTLFNQDATHGAILENLLNIKDRLQPNDLFYFYFSGHGDAYNAEKAFLLAFDSPSNKGKKEKNHYLTLSGAIDIHTIKTIFKEITYNGTTVVFISDACRTNELAGGVEGQNSIFKKIMEEDAGEIRLSSCSSNQVSFEGPQWGEGRGLFSYHLVNGMVGMADSEPEDGKVTIDELFTYIKSNVKKETYDTLQGYSLQTPQLSCRKENCESMVLNKINKIEKDRLSQALKNASKNYSNLYAYSVSKGSDLRFEMKQLGKEDLYNEYNSGLLNKKLIGPNSAHEAFQKIEKDNSIPVRLVNEFRGSLSNALLTDVARVINIYMNASQNNNLYTYDFFNNAFLELSVFKQIANPLFYNSTDVNVNLLFLEGHAQWKSTKSKELLSSLAKIDSAVVLKPEAAYLYNIKGLLHLKLKQYKLSLAAFNKGVELAPNWIYPLHNIGSVYSWLGQHDSSLVYYFKALNLDTTFQTSYMGVAGEFNSIGMEDSCFYYLNKGLLRDPKDPYLWYFLGNKYFENEVWDKSMDAYRKSYTFDSTQTIGYEGALRLHLKNYESIDSVMLYLNKMISLDSLNPTMYRDIGGILESFEYDSLAELYYHASVGLDTLNVESWNAWAMIYSKLGNDEIAENILYRTIAIDSAYSPTYTNMALILYRQEKVDQAKIALEYAIETNPLQEINYYYLGYIFLNEGNLDDAEKYFDLCKERNSYFTSVNKEFAQLYALQNRYDKALVYLELAIKQKYYVTKEEIKEDKAFHSIKRKKEFRRLMKKYF